MDSASSFATKYLLKEDGSAQVLSFWPFLLKLDWFEFS